MRGRREIWKNKETNKDAKKKETGKKYNKKIVNRIS